MQTLDNYIILFIFIARKRKMRKGELRNEGKIVRYRERMRGIVSYGDCCCSCNRLKKTRNRKNKPEAVV